MQQQQTPIEQIPEEKLREHGFILREQQDAIAMNLQVIRNELARRVKEADDSRNAAQEAAKKANDELVSKIVSAVAAETSKTAAAKTPEVRPPVPKSPEPKTPDLDSK